MAILDFFCDESGKYQKNPVVAITGLGAGRERLDPFNAEWQALLRSYGLRELHMSHAMQINHSKGIKLTAEQTLEERQQALFPFADCINKYLEIGLLQAWSVVGYAKLSLEVKKLLGGSHDPYQLAFVRGLVEIADFVGSDDHVNVICDDNLATAWDTYIHYREALKADSNRIEKFVGISFAKSFHYAPLQAADMVAFLARRAANEKFYGTPNDCKLLTDYLFADPSPPAIMRWSTGFWGEQEMVNLANAILDAKTKSVSEIQQAIEAEKEAKKRKPNQTSASGQA
jgi:hypothetical protein